MTAVAAALTACGGAAADDVIAEGPDLCAAAGKTSLVGEAPVTLVRSVTTTTAAADRWLDRSDEGGPVTHVADHSELDGTTPDAPLSVCVFRSSKPRPIPMSPGTKTVANGVQIFAQAPDRFVLDAIGPVDRLVARLDVLEAKPE